MKIVICITGGVLQGAYSDNKDLQVELFDTDNLEEELTSKAIDKLFDKMTDGLKVVY